MKNLRIGAKFFIGFGIGSLPPALVAYGPRATRANIGGLGRRNQAKRQVARDGYQPPAF